MNWKLIFSFALTIIIPILYLINIFLAYFLRNTYQGPIFLIILGILFAPDKGTETRRKISQSSKDMTNDVKEKITGFIGTVKEKFEPKEGHNHHEKAEKAKADMGTLIDKLYHELNMYHQQLIELESAQNIQRNMSLLWIKSFTRI